MGTTLSLSTNNLKEVKLKKQPLTSSSSNNNNQSSVLCLPLLKHLKPHNLSSVSAALWRLQSRFRCLSRFKTTKYDFVVVNSTFVLYVRFLDSRMALGEDSIDEIRGDGCQMGTFADLLLEDQDKLENSSASSSDFLTSEATGPEEEEEEDDEEEDEEEIYGISEVASSSPSSSWSMRKPEAAEVAPLDCSSDNEAAEVEQSKGSINAREVQKQGPAINDEKEIELMKERFSKLLLGEDMSGCGNGVSTALAISNAITNLCATLFGQLWRLEPILPEKKSMWRREMSWLLCVSDHIVQLVPTWQTFPDGTKLEVMTCRPRSDLYVNLPALCKLDNMLLEIMDSFESMEFWYVDQGILALDADGSSSFRQALQRQEEKWWLPVPRVPPGGLHDNSRKHLQHKRDCTNQILKAAMAINNVTLAEMEVPESYLDSLPKNGRACLGDIIYRQMASDQFSPECLLECLDLSSEHQAIEVANRIEASIYVWRKRTNSKPANNANYRQSSKSSWELVKELMMDGEKGELLAERAESLLLCLKQWFPGLPQTTLDMSKIQYNKDVGKSILESYSRVLESLAFNIVARIDDVMYVDDLTKHSDNFSSINKVGLIAQKSISIPYSVTVSATPYRTNFKTPSFSPAHLFSPAKVERSPFLSNGKLPQYGLGVKKVLTDYVSVIDAKGKEKSIELDSSLNTSVEASASPFSLVSPPGNLHPKK